MDKVKIEKIKKSNGRYKIIFNNGDVITTYDDVILKNDLLFDKNISKVLFDKIINDTSYYECYYKTINMISRRLRSEWEVRKYLNESGIKVEDSDRIILSLKNLGFINDLAFAKAYTNDRINLSLDGPFKIKNKLMEFNVSSEIISQVICFDKDFIFERINKVINKRKCGFKGSSFSFKQKTLVYLVNLGYDRDDVLECLASTVIPTNFDSMEKVYNKLLKKYSGDKLLYMLKGKLYSKGYSADDINDFVSKKTA